MIGLTDESREAWRTMSPRLYWCMEILAAIIFFIVFPVGFLAGAVWQGLIAGFVTGRDIK